MTAHRRQIACPCRLLVPLEGLASHIDPILSSRCFCMAAHCRQNATPCEGFGPLLVVLTQGGYHGTVIVL